MYTVSDVEASTHLDRDSYLNMFRDMDRRWNWDRKREMSRHRERERDRDMKLSVQDVNHVSWETVIEQLRDETAKATAEVVAEARKVLGELKPGERKTLTVKVGSITVARPK